MNSSGENLLFYSWPSADSLNLLIFYPMIIIPLLVTISYGLHTLSQLFINIHKVRITIKYACIKQAFTLLGVEVIHCYLLVLGVKFVSLPLSASTMSKRRPGFNQKVYPCVRRRETEINTHTCLLRSFKF